MADQTKGEGAFKRVAEAVATVARPSAEELRALETGPAKDVLDDDLADLERPAQVVEPPIQMEQDVLANDMAVLEHSPQGSRDALPGWAAAAIPADLEVPAGRTLVVMRFRTEWTDRKDKGDRTCVLWNLSVGDEKLANQRGGDNVFVNTMEMAKQMVRAIDGLRVDFTGKVPAAQLDPWWDEIGKKCRGLIINHFIRAHSLTTSEKMDFLAVCLVARTNLPPGARSRAGQHQTPPMSAVG
jgi:hypothetical protein